LAQWGFCFAENLNPQNFLEKMTEEFHLGHLIREELDRQNLTVVWFAEAINSDRSNCYDIFERKFINLELLERISKVLKRNFFKDLAEYEEIVVKIPTQM
jgi:predicted transcriptional regulator